MGGEIGLFLCLMSLVILTLAKEPASREGQCGRSQPREASEDWTPCLKRSKSFLELPDWDTTQPTPIDGCCIAQMLLHPLIDKGLRLLFLKLLIVLPNIGLKNNREISAH